MKLATKPPRKVQQPSGEADSASRLTGLRILVVEDVGMVAMALKAMLEEIGCRVIGTASRLQEAEEICRREDLDGVLLDVNLSGQYSYPVVEILRNREIPFIIMSGYDTAQLRPDLSEAPQMQKPFERRTLEILITNVFCARSKGSESGPPMPPHRSVPAAPAPQPASMKTQGEIESAVCQGMCRFEQEYIGRGPSDVREHLLGDLLVVRLQGVLTAAEQRMVEAHPVEQGRELLKKVRTLLIETAQMQISSVIQMITGVTVVSMHHDISTVTGEEVVLFSLSQAPQCRVSRPR